MARVVFEVSTLEPPILFSLMGALIAINLDYLRSNPQTPKLYKSGIRYQAETFPDDYFEQARIVTEIFADIPSMLKSGVGDCEDLVCWRVAELLAHGVQAFPMIERTPLQDTNGDIVQANHITVGFPNGSRECPSTLLGM